jgi:adenine-specific DNA methylase
MCVVGSRQDEQGRFYRLPTTTDFIALGQATAELKRKIDLYNGPLSLVPDEEISLNEIRRISPPLYGMARWGDLFTARELLSLSTFVELVHRVRTEIDTQNNDSRFATAIQTCLALAVSRQTDYTTSLCSWHTTGEKVNHTFGRQAIPMFWDYTEVFPLSKRSGDFGGALEWVRLTCEGQSRGGLSEGQVERGSATSNPLPENSAHALITDPPYYDAVPYAYLSDFFYVWLRRMLHATHPDLFSGGSVPKEEEIVVDRPHELSQSNKGIPFYERELTKAFAESRRVVRPDGIGMIVFASKTTASWEAILNAIIQAGWIITASWPIDTEMEARVAAQGQARLASSIHIVCRPRGDRDRSVHAVEVGDWRDILAELPKRIHEWMPRLASEGVVGADAIFACLGPSLEIFSRYALVEKASGEQVALKGYLEYVWAAVAKEALNMIFEGADATGFEEDARLSAMWLWTLSTGTNGNGLGDDEREGEEEGEESTKKTQVAGYVLEYDAARKIAQGLGAHLERLTSLVEINGEAARLLPVSERAKYLFGKDEGAAPTKRKAKPRQLSLLEELGGLEEEGGWGEKSAPKVGNTVLDRVHQSMILFAAGRNEALKRFLVTDGAGQDHRFWHLADALCKLYPAGTDERRWVEGVMARKKGLGL